LGRIVTSPIQPPLITVIWLYFPIRLVQTFANLTYCGKYRETSPAHARTAARAAYSFLLICWSCKDVELY
jgi:hypothetical protein